MIKLHYIGGIITLVNKEDIQAFKTIEKECKRLIDNGILNICERWEYITYCMYEQNMIDECMHITGYSCL